MTTTTRAETIDRHPTIQGTVLPPTLPKEGAGVAVASMPLQNGVKRQIPIFLLVGGITFLVDAGLMRSAYGLGMALDQAFTLGFVVGLVCHFTLNRILTFRPQGGSTSRQVVFYSANVAISYLLQRGIVTLGHKWTGIDPAAWKCAAVVVTMVITFFWLRHLVFASAGTPAKG